MTSLLRGTWLRSRKRNCAGHPGRRENAAGVLQGGYTQKLTRMQMLSVFLPTNVGGLCLDFPLFRLLEQFKMFL